MSVESELLILKSLLRPLNIYKLSGNTLVDFELEAYAVGLNVVNEALDELEKEAFIATAETYGITNREAICGKIKISRLLNERREMLIYRNSISSKDFTKSGIEKALVSVGLQSSINENLDGDSIYINCFSVIDDLWTTSEIEEAAKKFLPAHLSAEFDYRVISWDNIDNRELTFSYIDNKEMTWNSIDNFNR